MFTSIDAKTMTKVDPNFTFDSQLSQILAQANEISRRVVDYKVQATSLKAVLSFDAENLRVVPMLSIDTQLFEFSQHGFSELCYKTGMGNVAYMTKLLDQKEDFLNNLAIYNVNQWLRSLGDKTLFVRTYNDVVATVLSEKYQPYDHHEVIDVIRKEFHETDYQIERFSIDPMNLFVRMVDPEKFLVPTSSNESMSTAGLMIRNGQMGNAPLRIDFAVYTFWCTNGLILGSDYSRALYKRHIGISDVSFTGAVTSTLADFPEYVDFAKRELEGSRRLHMTDEQIDSAYARMQKELKLSEENTTQLKLIRSQSWDNSAWGVASALTQLAQTFTPVNQIAAEQYAGQLISRLVA